MIKQLKLLAIGFVGAFAALSSTHTAVVAQDQPGRLFELVGMNVPFEQRVGAADGAAFVVHFAGDTRGSLDTCG